MRFTVSFLTAFLLPGAFAQDDCPAKQIYVKGVGCLPKLDRNGKTMVYKHQPSTLTLVSHRVKAELCGGHVASVLSSEEQVQMDNMKISGMVLIGYSQPSDCNDEPRGCWEWDDGSAVGFTHWSRGQPNDLQGQDCVEVRYWFDLKWNDLNCSYPRKAVYILPADFTRNKRCQWYVEPDSSSSSKSPSFSSKAPSFSSKSPSFSSKAPSFPSKSPTTEQPTGYPTLPPSEEPTEEPTNKPTNPPTHFPTEEPTAEPTEEPTAEPTEVPTVSPTDVPTVSPTETPVCNFGNLKLCLKGGCIWTPEKRNEPAKCTPCSNEKKSKSCVKNGCIWKDAKGKKPAECSACADQKTSKCSKKGCVTTKAKGKTTCTSCVSLSTSKTKCFQGKCAYDIKKKACATCVSVTKEKSCDEQKGCAWKPGKKGKKGTCDKKKGKIVLDCCDWGSEPCELDCNARQETLNK